MLKSFRVVAFLEGVSYILLLFIATPIKYFGEDPTYVKMLGIPHGLLFMAYVIMALVLRSEKKWPNLKTVIVLLASIIPFGTFYVDRKYLK
ncbi:MAG: integral membrane protein [Bacteroidia bacterium]|jgi:integral membrane protein